MAVMGTRVLRSIDLAIARLMDRLQDAYDVRVRRAMQSPNETRRRVARMVDEHVLTLVTNVRRLLENRPLR